MFLFILESIGTSELILIGIIALIFLGPRKLPQIAKSIGKTMADFRNTTNEFKSTWEREVNFEEEAEALRSGELAPQEASAIVHNDLKDESSTNTLAMPEIKPAQSDLFSNLSSSGDETSGDETEETFDAEASEKSDKRTWL